MSDNKNDNTEEEFPGYPHYPAKDDIMNQKDVDRVEADLDDLSRANLTSSALPDKSVKTPQANDAGPAVGDIDDDDITRGGAGTDADVTQDDLIALGERDADFGRRETLQTNGEDLDVPGAEDDDLNEEIGEEDEENNYYSLGGDAHENLEEDPNTSI
jgi:hypothetical protein